MGVGGGRDVRLLKGTHCLQPRAAESPGRQETRLPGSSSGGGGEEALAWLQAPSHTQGRLGQTSVWGQLLAKAHRGRRCKEERAAAEAPSSPDTQRKRRGNPRTAAGTRENHCPPFKEGRPARPGAQAASRPAGEQPRPASQAELQPPPPEEVSWLHPCPRVGGRV